MATARGFGTARGNRTGSGDFTLIAAPETQSGTATIYLLSLHLSIKTLSASSRVRVEDGVGGAVIARLAGGTADAELDVNYTTNPHHGGYVGMPLSAGNLLNINLSDGTVSVDYLVSYEVR